MHNGIHLTSSALCDCPLCCCGYVAPLTQAANYADQGAEIATLSAAVLFPCSPTAAAPAAAAAGSSGSSSSSSDSEPNPLFNTRALQLWVLRGCQQLKGGLRDKPGKSADYYHTCYCLSGLSAAQHIMGAFVLGQQDSAAVGSAGQGGQGSGGSSRKGVFAQLGGNRLAAADPLLNVVVDKVQAAKVFYEATGPVL